MVGARGEGVEEGGEGIGAGEASVSGGEKEGKRGGGGSGDESGRGARDEEGDMEKKRKRCLKIYDIQGNKKLVRGEFI